MFIDGVFNADSTILTRIGGTYIYSCIRKSERNNYSEERRKETGKADGGNEKKRKQENCRGSAVLL